MRKTLFSLALAMAVLSSCSSDDIVNNPMNEENHSFPASRSLHENILSFSSEEEYNALLDSLGTLSDEELLQWESGQKGFTSMYRMHSEALGQILNATCKEEYESIKTAYQTDFIFNDKDSTDLSIYMPVLNVSKAITLTPEGFVCIAGERKNMKEFENYDGYNIEVDYFSLSFIIYTQQKRKNKAILDFKILPSIHDFLLLVILIKYKQYCYN